MHDVVLVNDDHSIDDLTEDLQVERPVDHSIFFLCLEVEARALIALVEQVGQSLRAELHLNHQVYTQVLLVLLDVIIQGCVREP